MTTRRMTENKCLNCGYTIDAATNLTDRKRMPTSGDVSICLMCGHLMGFNDDLTLRELTSEEMYMIAGDKTILEIQRVRSIVMNARNGKNNS